MAGSKTPMEVKKLEIVTLGAMATVESAKAVIGSLRNDAKNAEKAIMKKIGQMRIDYKALEISLQNARNYAQAILEAEQEYSEKLRENVSREEMVEAKTKMKRTVAALEKACKRDLANANAVIKAIHENDQKTKSVVVDYTSLMR